MRLLFEVTLLWR